MQWCLWEAIRDRQRKALRCASTIALALDERAARELITFAACSKRGLDVTRGILGIIRHQGKTARDVATALDIALQQMCTLRAPHPHMNRSHGNKKGRLSSLTGVCKFYGSETLNSAFFTLRV